MKNYTLEIIDKDEKRKQSKSFILKYEIIYTKDNKKMIIVYYANGKKTSFDYTKYLEETILGLMESNIHNYEDIMGKYSAKKRYRDYISEVVILFGKLLIFSPIGSGIIFRELIFSLVIMLLAGSIMFSGLIYKKIYTKRYEDYQKNVLFLENEERINQQFLENNDSNINVDNNNKNIVVKPNGRIGYTINSIDKMSLQELKVILEQIKDKERGLISLDNGKKVKKKTLIR